MILIKLIEARKNLWHRCKELFTDEKIAEQIYRYLCEGLEECENQKTSDVVKVRNGRWEGKPIAGYSTVRCSVCRAAYTENNGRWSYCPDCGSLMDLDEVAEK